MVYHADKTERMAEWGRAISGKYAGMRLAISQSQHANETTLRAWAREMLATGALKLHAGVWYFHEDELRAARPVGEFARVAR